MDNQQKIEAIFRNTPHTKASGTTISFSLINWRKDDEEAQAKNHVEKFLQEGGEGLRNLESNDLLGLILSQPTLDQGSSMLGISYYDKKEQLDNEDLFLISNNSITRKTRLEMKREYQNGYSNYHKEPKDFFRRDYSV